MELLKKISAFILGIATTSGNLYLMIVVWHINPLQFLVGLLLLVISIALFYAVLEDI